MNKNVRIAKELVRIAKMMVADDSAVDNEKFFKENVVSAKFNGFVTSRKDDDVLFTMDDSETEYIVFGKIEGGQWGYTVYVNDEEIATVEKDTCEEAFIELKSNIVSYQSKMKVGIDARNKSMKEEKDVISGVLGTCSYSEVENVGQVKDTEGYLYGDDKKTYAIDFKPKAEAKPESVAFSKKKIVTKLRNNMYPAKLSSNGLVVFFMVDELTGSNLKSDIAGIVHDNHWELV